MDRQPPRFTRTPCRFKRPVSARSIRRKPGTRMSPVASIPANASLMRCTATCWMAGNSCPNEIVDCWGSIHRRVIFTMKRP